MAAPCWVVGTEFHRCTFSPVDVIMYRLFLRVFCRFTDIRVANLIAGSLATVDKGLGSVFVIVAPVSPTSSGQCLC